MAADDSPSDANTSPAPASSSSASSASSALSASAGLDDPVPDRELAALGESLRELRARAGISVRALAEKPGVHYSHGALNRAENCKKLPTYPVVEAFVRGCDGDVEHFKELWDAAARSKEGSADIAASPEPGTLRRLVAWLQYSRRRRYGAVAVAALAVVGLVAASAGATIAITRPTPPSDPTAPIMATPADQCFPDVVRRGPAGECVGFSDGGYAFDPALGLQPILSKIKQENDRVYETGEPSVSLAYVAPLPRTPLTPAGESYLEQVKHELIGGLLAQLRANETPTLGAVPKIRLLVANVGDGSALWRDVVPMLADQTTQPNRLVATFGLGLSLRSTLEMLDDLNARNIPMFPARLTADVLSLTGKPPNGLFRVAPTNSSEAAVAVSYMRSISAQRVLVIEDRNPDDEYAQDLNSGLTNALAARPGGPERAEPEPFNSALGYTANAFSQMIPSICFKQPDTIYFAGRGSDLSAFLQVLSTRSGPCLQQRMTVLTGDDGSSVTLTLRDDLATNKQALSKALAEGNMVFQYTGLSHPAAWDAPNQGFVPASIDPFRGSCDTCLQTLFPGTPLDDDAAILAYDAALTPISCIRNASRGQQPPAPDFYNPGLVTQSCYRVNQFAPVAGASGSIAFDGQGNAVNKLLPIVELRSDGSTGLISLPRSP